MEKIKQTLKALLLAYVTLGVVIGACYTIRQLTKRSLPSVMFEAQEKTPPTQ
jgi:hypothetical protein